MINLLPTEEKKKVRTIYRARVAVVVLIFLTVLALLSLASLAPSYFAASSKYDAASLASEITESENKMLKEDLESMAKEANKAAALLSSQNADLSPRGVFSEIVSLKQSGIRITGLSYSIAVAAKKGEQQSREKRIAVSGAAETRESLLSFMDTLKSKDLFASADLPISNFVKERDLDFSINILLSTSTQP